MLTDDELIGSLIDPNALAHATSLLRRPTNIIEFVGDRGWGKSTNLTLLRRVGTEVLGERWRFTYVPLGTSRVARPLGDVDRWCIDEADRISTARMRRIFDLASKSGLKLVLSTHRSLAHLNADRGVRLQSFILPAPRTDMIAAFIERRIAFVRVSHDVRFAVDREALEALSVSVGGNLRRVEEVMYEVFQQYAYAGCLPDRMMGTDVEAGMKVAMDSYEGPHGIVSA